MSRVVFENTRLVKENSICNEDSGDARILEVVF